MGVVNVARGAVSESTGQLRNMVLPAPPPSCRSPRLLSMQSTKAVSWYDVQRPASSMADNERQGLSCIGLFLADNVSRVIRDGFIIVMPGYEIHIFSIFRVAVALPFRARGGGQHLLQNISIRIRL